MTYKVNKVDESTYQIVEQATNVEFCVCASFDSECAPANERAIFIANNLNEALKPKEINWLFQEPLGNGVFEVVITSKGKTLFVWLDKHGIFNIFEEIEQFLNYWEGQLNGCIRVCIDGSNDPEGNSETEYENWLNTQ